MPEERKRDFTLEDAGSYLLSLLARREYSRYQLTVKLQSRGLEEDQIDQLLSQFEAKGYLSDQRFAEMVIRQRTNQGYGHQRIRFELQQKGISAELISELLDNVEQSPKRQALSYVRRKYGAVEAIDVKERAKRTRHLSNRGFTFDQIRYALDHQNADPD